MQIHQVKQEGRVVLNMGGCKFETSVQTLQRLPNKFFDAYFSGRYAQDVCEDGSIFVDRDGAHFGHDLEYMRDGVMSVADPGALPSVSLLQALKSKFGFYCIELRGTCGNVRTKLYTLGGLMSSGAMHVDNHDIVPHTDKLHPNPSSRIAPCTARVCLRARRKTRI
jgi:hypothetical protein